MNEEQRRAILPELDRLTREAEKIRKELDDVVKQQMLYNDANLTTADIALLNALRALRHAAETIRKDCAPVQDYVTSWYKALHFDMSDPLVEVAEEDLTDPVYESCTYDGNEQWTVIMQTVTHGREKVIVQSDGVSYFQVYSAEKI